MASKMPSMTALLGLLAIAGYQNRDKIAEMLKGAGATGDKPGSGTQPGLGGLLGNLGGVGATGGVGGLLGGGLGELLERFKQSGQGEVAQSWPLGEVHRVATWFCGGAAVTDGPYCTHHLRMARRLF
jgi:uncharacterized protein YidB (DUF937 family)